MSFKNIYLYTNYCWLYVQTKVQEMQNFQLVLSIENGCLYNGYSIQQNVTVIYSTNNIEI